LSQGRLCSRFGKEKRCPPLLIWYASSKWFSIQSSDFSDLKTTLDKKGKRTQDAESGAY
jgi:hypothetical protein